MEPASDSSFWGKFLVFSAFEINAGFSSTLQILSDCNSNANLFSSSSNPGLVMVEGKEYKQVPKFNFRLSMAALDLETAKGPISLKVKINGSDFILCNLSKESPQSHLDLIFGEGEPIKFYTTGSGSVHLTGYSLPEDSLGDEFDEEFSDDESMDSEIEKLNLLAANNKRKNTESLKLTGKDAKKLKTDAKPEPAKVQKVIDVDPKQLLQKKDNKAPDAQQKGKQQANQPQPKKDNKPPTENKPAKKALEESDDEDDDDGKWFEWIVIDLNESKMNLF